MDDPVSVTISLSAEDADELRKRPSRPFDISQLSDRIAFDVMRALPAVPAVPVPIRPGDRVQWKGAHAGWEDTVYEYLGPVAYRSACHALRFGSGSVWVAAGELRHAPTEEGK